MRTPQGVTIEVKSCSYAQEGHCFSQCPSRIAWSGPTGQTWDAGMNLCSGERTYNARLYVFSVQTEKNPRRWNALDLDQWRFYMLTRQQGSRLNVRSLSESRLRTLAQPMTAAEFRLRGREAIANFAPAGEGR